MSESSDGRMTRDQAKKLLEYVVNDKTGIKGIELAMHVDTVALSYYPEFDITEMLDELVAEGRIVCVEYTLPPDNTRIKGYYLPAGSQLYVKGMNPCVDFATQTVTLSRFTMRMVHAVGT